MGSKNRISKFIVPIMLDYRKSNQWWVEPFVGGGNTIDKVTGNRLGADLNKYAIEALISIRDRVNFLPRSLDDFNESDYRKLKKDDSYEFKGYIGFTASYGGRFLEGWARGEGRDYIKESYNNAVKQSPNLQGVKLVVSDYKDLDIPPNSLIYCDPPYRGTTNYRKTIDHDDFWEWCRAKVREGHTVFVSEFEAPEDFELLWGMERKTSLTKDTGSKSAVEKLFIYKG